MLLAQAPDFICLQEFDPLYRTPSDGSDSLIKLISGKYTEVAIDGVEKNTVYNPVFFDHTRYTLVTSGYVEKYASNSVEYSYPGYPTGYTGVKEDGNTYCRSLVWAVLKDAWGDLFLIANVHFSQVDAGQNGDLTERAAIQSAEAVFVANKVKEIANGYEGITVLVGGDMNSNATTNAGCGVDTMLSNGFTHTYNLASDKNNVESYHDGKAPTTGYLEYAIDHILTLNEALNVRSFYVLNDEALYAISDHLPVKMTFCK